MPRLKRDTHEEGLTIIELLVVMVVFGIILAVLSAFLIQQMRVTARIQAQNEVEINVRSIAENLIQDLQLAGSQAVYREGVGTSGSVAYLTLVAGECSSVDRDGCVKVGSGDADVSIFYATSLRDTNVQSCRRIDYRYTDDNQLFRRDGLCTDGDPNEAAFNGFELADSITNFTLTFRCEDNRTGTNPATCYTDNPSNSNLPSYPLEVIVTVAGSSTNTREDIQSTISLSTNLPNLRPPVDFQGSN